LTIRQANKLLATILHKGEGLLPGNRESSVFFGLMELEILWSQSLWGKPHSKANVVKPTALQLCVEWLHKPHCGAAGTKSINNNILCLYWKLIGSKH